MIKYLPITFNEIPIDIIYTIKDVDYTFKFRYNERFDFITVEIYNKETLLSSCKLIYGNNIMQSYIGLPAIIPLTEKDLSNEGYSDIQVNKETLGTKVFLFLNDGV